MKRIIVILFLSIHCFLGVVAQEAKEDFQTYRKNILTGYQSYRQNILDDYAKFLNGIWNEYEIFAGKKANPLPKPKTQPQIAKEEPQKKPVSVVPEEIKPVEPAVENISPETNPLVMPPIPMTSVNWCGMEMQLPEVRIKENLNSINKESLASYWEILDNTNLCKKVFPQMTNIATSCNFNDWCLCMLFECYVKRIKADADYNTRNFICWYLMVNYGYDARLTFNGTQLFYLIPFQQQVFARDYLTIKGEPYYLWGEGTPDKEKRFSTPELPEKVGEPVNLVFLKPLNIPYRAKSFSHTFAGKTLSVSVNENLIQVMKQIPQMPVPAYAYSAGDHKFRTQLLNQIKQFINGMNELDAANFILQFIQSLEYATDEEQFGYEKPFFIEESLYYPKCDCEDRAVFYYFLVTQLLGRDVHLVHYPNHECTAVNFSKKLSADYYTYEGKQFVICDPTYIGASIGMCMPDFKEVKPEIELVR